MFDLEAAATVRVPPRTESSRAGVPIQGRKRWHLRTSPLRGKLQHSGLPPLVALILENRGIGTLSEAQRFLGGKETSLGDPASLPGFDTALGLLRNAVRDRKLVCVYGDFDVDGITSTAILTETLRDLGGEVLPYIPNREREGYGLNLCAIDSLADRGVDVLVTCDCGTSSLLEVERARELGLEVIVVDHHLPPAELPDASAFLNPKLPDADYGFTDYASGGVSFRLAEALYGSARRPFPEQQYVELAALATVADMVPLLDENREIVRRGLAAMAQTKRPGLVALMQVSGVDPKKVSSESIAFSLAPRINAAGRLSDAKLALDLLLTTEEGTALSLASTIDALNRERQRMTLEAQDLARRKLEDGPDTPILIVGDAGFHQGIIGLVASRLVETFGRPAAVYQQGEIESRGSCRSITEYDITGGLRSCGDLFERFGGHKAAAGFTIRNDRLVDLEQRLTEHASGLLRDVELSPSVEIDAEWPLDQLRSQEIIWLGKLQPHGVGNPDPKLLSRGVSVLEAKRVGDDSRHLKLRLKHGPVVWPAIAFGWEGDVPEEGSRIDLVYSLSADRYGPSEQGGALQLTVVDLAPSS